MKLSYRGIYFNKSAEVIDMSDKAVAGAYRGVDVAFRNPQLSVPNSAIALQYRGIAYLRSC